MYYLYIIYNPLTNLPFYVGIGKESRRGKSGTRYLDHVKEALLYRNNPTHNCNRHKLSTILKIIDSGQAPFYVIAKNNLLETEIHDLEKKLISYYGRRDLNTGILTNMSPGGEGNTEWSAESKNKLSTSLKGKPSPLRNRKIGQYSSDRVSAQKDGIAHAKQALTVEQKSQQTVNRSNARKGKIPWNKGLTKETSASVANYAKAKVGKSRPDMIGRAPWNSGKNKSNDPKLAELSEKLQGREAHNKGKVSPNKGKTYEEIHGVEKAAALRELRRIKKDEFWASKKSAKY